MTRAGSQAVPGYTAGRPFSIERSMLSVPDRRRVVPQMGDDRQERGIVMPQTTEPRYLRTAHVAELLHASSKTVCRWAQAGRLHYLRALGGPRRYPDREIRALLATLSEPSP